VPCARLSWPSRQPSSARKSTVSYRIVMPRRERSHHSGQYTAREEDVTRVAEIGTKFICFRDIRIPNNTVYARNGKPRLNPLYQKKVGSKSKFVDNTYGLLQHSARFAIVEPSATIRIQNYAVSGIKRGSC